MVSSPGAGVSQGDELDAMHCHVRLYNACVSARHKFAFRIGLAVLLVIAIQRWENLHYLLVGLSISNREMPTV